MMKKEGKIQRSMKEAAEIKVMSCHFLFNFNLRKKIIAFDIVMFVHTIHPYLLAKNFACLKTKITFITQSRFECEI